MKQFISTIENGMVKVPQPYKEGERVMVTLKKWRKLRSNQQNRFWHGVWLPLIADELGYIEPEEVCKAVKIRLGLCKVEKDKITGGKRWVCQSTADMSVADMADFLNKVEALMQEFQIFLPSREWY